MGFIAGVDQTRQFVGFGGEGFFEEADVLQRTELVVDAAGVLVFAIHLDGVEAEDEARFLVVADHAVGAAGVVPGLLARAAGGAGVANRIRLAEDVFAEQLGVGLFVVPDVGVADPLLASLGAGIVG